MTCFLVNPSPSYATDKKTLEELWLGTLTSYSDLKFFGCPRFVHVDNKKLEPTSKQCLFVGYKSCVKGYNLWDPEASKVVISRDVIFNKIDMLRGSSAKVSNSISN